jgi:short subunit dehydrogenase-like uncharacterized protein
VAERDFDVVVFGATGVTGRLVAAYLAERSPELGARWAAAARDPAKLERVLDEAGVTTPETIVADVDDPASLAAMASRARVVLNMVGPYTKYARPVIEACVAGRAHYADLTGEIAFARRMIDAFDTAAAEAGVKIVQICGFEALPPDLTVLLALETARERWGEDVSSVDVEVTVKAPVRIPRPSDVLSGGTLQSMLEIMSDESASSINDPAALITDPRVAAEVRRRSPISLSPRGGSRGAVMAPMAPSAFINPAVIHRSAALLGAESGAPEPFRYREGMALRGPAASLPVRYAMAGALSGVQAGLVGVASASVTLRRRITAGLRRVVPESGFGPGWEHQQDWRWRLSARAQTAGGHEARVELDADGHPGYLATGRMLGEAGLLMAEPGATPERAGCLTPATALGTGCVERFERAGLRFSAGA